jgi:hypothetical protein
MKDARNPPATKLHLATQSSTIRQLEQLNQELGGDAYLTFKLNNLPANYTYHSRQSDDELLAEALCEKYAR